MDSFSPTLTLNFLHPNPDPTSSLESKKYPFFLFSFLPLGYNTPCPALLTFSPAALFFAPNQSLELAYVSTQHLSGIYPRENNSVNNQVTPPTVTEPHRECATDKT